MKKRTLFVSAMLGAMAMTTTLTSCVKDEVSSSVAADRNQHLQDKKDQTAIANAQTYSNLLSTLRYYKEDLFRETQNLEEAKDKLAKLQSGVEPLTAYWNDQVAEKQADLDAAKKQLETLQNLKGMDGDALADEWAKANEAYDAANEAYKAKYVVVTTQGQSLNLKETELTEIPAVKLATQLGSKYLGGIPYASLNADLDGTPVNLFKAADMFSSTQFPDLNYGWGYLQDDNYDYYQSVSVQNQKIADAIYKDFEENVIKPTEDYLGKDTDEADATGSLYAQLAQAKKDLEAATTDLDKLNLADVVKTKQNDVDNQINSINNLKKNLDELKTTVAEVSKGVPQEFYDAYIKDVVAYDKAQKESIEAYKPVAQAQAVKNALSNISAYSAGWGNIDDAIESAKSDIVDCEAALISAKDNQAKLRGAYGVTPDYQNYAEAIKAQQNDIERFTSYIATYNSNIAVIEKLLAILASKL